MRLVVLRLLTTLIISGLCGLTAFQGWSIAYLAAKGAPSVASAALRASLAQMAPATGPDVARKRVETLTALLAIRPMSSTDWLALAGLRVVTARPYDEMTAALRMSSLTGPNEGSVMAERGIFGVLQWDTLPREARSETIADLSGAILDNAFTAAGLEVAKYVLRQKPLETQGEIASWLRREGVSAHDLGRLGL